jgi:hypothetical protein
MRWVLLKDRGHLKPEAAADLDALIAKMTTVRTARAWRLTVAPGHAGLDSGVCQRAGLLGDVGLHAAPGASRPGP